MYLYPINYSVALYVDHCMCYCVVIVLVEMYIVFVGKIKYICYSVFVCSEYKNNILKSVVSVTLNKKRP